MVEAGVFALGRAQPSSWAAAATTKPSRSSWQAARPVVPRVARPLKSSCGRNGIGPTSQAVACSCDPHLCGACGRGGWNWLAMLTQGIDVHVDARDALTDSDRLAVVVQLEHQVAVLSRKLGFGQPYGGGDGS